MKSRADIDKMSPSQLVSWFMIGSYAYYKLGRQLMDDPEFDYLVNRLKKDWPNINHPHTKLIKKSHLEASTGYDIEYPNIVKCCAAELLTAQ